MPSPSPAPAAEYQRRLTRHQSAVEALEASELRFAYGRLGVFAAGVATAVLGWNAVLGWGWLLVPAACFLLLVLRHDGVIHARKLSALAVRFYERGLARIEDRWPGMGGETGERFGEDEHLYAIDLDLFGRGSLFEMLSIARTRVGEATLAGWLTTPAPAIEIRARQEAVAELAPRLDFREALSRADAAVGATVPDHALVRWAGEAPLLRSRWLRPLARFLTLAVVASAGWWAATGTAEPFFVVLVAQLAFSLPLRRRVQQALHAADAPARELDAIAVVLEHFEAEAFEAPRLTALQRGLQRHGVAGSTAIRRLHRLVELHDWQHNQFFAPIGAVLLWGTHLAWAIETWRLRYGPFVAGWLQAVGELEALDSLAAYHYEQPEDVWPEIVERHPPEAPALFEATHLGHPLLPRERAIRNDVKLGSGRSLLMVSGSNMSGKSTLLRTVGINAVLALAGAPVRAEALRLAPLALGATLRIQDSLQEGRSRFYAEITRVRRIVEAGAGPLPLLFLFDEMFQGTNSHDRLAGSIGVLRILLEHGAVGLVTTHDLALTGVADTLGARAANVHFEDRFEGDELVFDYRMKPGPVGRGNGLALMRAVGLDVDDLAAP